MLIPRLFSWKHISAYLGAKTPSVFGDLLPSPSTVIFTAFALFACLLSELVRFRKLIISFLIS